MPFAYYARLSARSKATYRKSDAVERVPLPDAPALRALVDEVAAALADEDRHATQSACQRLADAMLAQLKLPPVRLSVLAARPSHDWGELHGYYDPTQPRVPPTITLWMRTAQRKQVVAFRTFLRTFLHEIGHHLDYELLQLAETFHTEGFYKRESSLFHQLVPEAGEGEGTSTPAGPAAKKPAARRSTPRSGSGEPSS